MKPYIIYHVAKLSPDLDILEAECLHALWLRSQPGAVSPDEPVSAEEVASDLRTKIPHLKENKVMESLDTLVLRTLATAHKKKRTSGRPGRHLRGFKIATSDKIVTWPATAAMLDFVSHHRMLPLTQHYFNEEVLARGFVDHKSGVALTNADLERQAQYCFGRGYLVRELTDGTAFINIGDRTRREVHYIKLLGNHAQPTADSGSSTRKPPGVAPQDEPDPSGSSSRGDADESKKKAI